MAILAPQRITAVIERLEQARDSGVIDRLLAFIPLQILLADIGNVAAVGIFGEQMVEGLIAIRPDEARGFRIAIETNGTLPVIEGVDWICVSPKAGTKIVQRKGDELKMVWPQPGLDVQEIEGWDFRHWLVQPMDGAAAEAAREAAIRFVLGHPRWRLSLQTHKMLGLR